MKIPNITIQDDSSVLIFKISIKNHNRKMFEKVAKKPTMVNLENSFVYFLKRKVFSLLFAIDLEIIAGISSIDFYNRKQCLLRKT